MDRQDEAMSLELDGVTAILLIHLAEVWGVTEEEAVQRAIGLANTALGPLTDREVFLLTRYLEVYSQNERAVELNEDELLTRFHLNVVRAKVHYRLEKAMKKTTATDRLETFKELQRSLQLTSAKAKEWQDAVREARR